MPSHRTRQRLAPRRRYLAAASGLAVVAVLAALLTAGYLLGRGGARPGAAPPAAAAEGRPGSHGASPRGTTSHGASPHGASPRSATPSHPDPTRSRLVPSPHPSSAPTQSPSPTPATSSPGDHGKASSSAVAAVLAMINQARAQAGLPAYTVIGGLVISAGRHNRLMADGCGLSHQCPGEPPLGTRETDAGVHWTAAGENIGEGGPVADTTAAITQMAVALTQDMLNEQPPDDGHRLNLLSSTFTHIGIAIYRDSHGTVWMTQDFAN
ncbi:MAG TPA: CAP domain-containing protein [Streptosporangiaceae bacterium]|nr:CAP domain-containing protein [Streptosporangiaceae bacterium]